MNKIVLLRHGESTWNQENRFTGWTDVGLTDKGLAEARAAGQLLKREGYDFDVALTSVLRRAIKTLWVALEEMDRMWIPIHHSWRLNERLCSAENVSDEALEPAARSITCWGRNSVAFKTAATRSPASARTSTRDASRPTPIWRARAHPPPIDVGIQI